MLVQYRLRNAVFHYHRVLKDTTQQINEFLEVVPGKWSLKTDGRKLHISGEGQLTDGMIEAVGQILAELGNDAARATMIEECINGERKIRFVGPSDTAVNMLSRAYLEPEWRKFTNSIRSMFEQYPTLQSFNLQLGGDGGRAQCFAVALCDMEWAGEPAVTPEALLEDLQEREIEVDLLLADGRTFHRDDYPTAAHRATKRRDARATA